MVYYTALPLIMQNDQQQEQTQVCSNSADQRNTTRLNYHNVSSQASSSPTIKMEYQQSQQQLTMNSTGSTMDDQSNAYFHQQINKTQKQQFECDQCHMCFGSKSAHTSHIKSHAKQYHQSQNNGVTTMVTSPSSFSESNMSASGNGGSSSSSSGSSTAEPYQCDVCKKTFAVPARLVRHYRTHTGERPFACEFCHKTFSVKENLQVHRRIHTKERPYKCEVCGRAFEHSGKLHRHMRIHTGERPHKCSVCGKTFIQSGQLVIHMRTHTGEKPYKCPVEGCGKGFTCSKQLKVHSRTHTGEKPYHCDICFRDFGYNHVLKLHRVQHYGSKCYKCTICDETFKSKKEMEAHIKGHANDIPDEEDQQNDNSILSVKSEGNEIVTSPNRNDEPLELMSPPKSNRNLSKAPTPKDSESDTNSDGDEIAYYNMYPRFEQRNNCGPSTGLNPVLLEAASIAARVACLSPSPPTHNTNNGSNNNTSSSNTTVTLHSMQPPEPLPPPPQPQSITNHFVYENPLAAMRQHSYFSPPLQSPEFRPSMTSANLVRRVEEAIAIAEPLLTPPRSSPESPDRSSSPETDIILMADRDIMSLPPRKRKLYLKDNQNTNSAPNLRMSSVIQFAKAS
jgi:uncharacterized Zn-finger protein